jgi:SAM-dependent methyltransferase
MRLSERLAAFKRIKAHFDSLDREGLRHGRLPMRSTEFGFWGTTNMNDAYTFFSRIRLERFKGFVDLGCGDGRIVLIASLFTNATGIEGETELVDIGNKAIKEIRYWEGGPGSGATGPFPVTLKNKDYATEDLSQYDVLFMFPDKRFDAAMVGKLLSEFRGYLFVYNRVYAPAGIKAGKTYWIDQLPIASYAINVEERNLEME